MFDVSFNEIPSLNGLSKVSSTVKELYVSKNEVAKMEELEHFHALEMLELGSNRLRVSMYAFLHTPRCIVQYKTWIDPRPYCSPFSHMFHSISGDGKSGNLDKSTRVMAWKKPNPDNQLMWFEINQENKFTK